MPRFTPQEITAAKLDSRRARDALLYLKRERVNYTKPARGHMPFEGHRTCAEVRFDERLNRKLVEVRRG